MNFLEFSFYIVSLYEVTFIVITKWFILFYFDLGKNMWIDDVLHFKWKYKLGCHLFDQCIWEKIMLWLHMSLSMKLNIMLICYQFHYSHAFGFVPCVLFEIYVSSSRLFFCKLHCFYHSIFFICVNKLKKKTYMWLTYVIPLVFLGNVS